LVLNVLRNVPTAYKNFITPPYGGIKGEHFMKNAIKNFEIIAIIAIIGFSLITCDDGSGDGGSGNNGGSVDTAGRITFTGLSEYNGKYVYGGTRDGDGSPSLHASASTSTTGKMIENGSVTLKVWKFDKLVNTLVNYEGNDKNVIFFVTITDNSNPQSTVLKSLASPPVSFTNGIATVAFPN
jgi:hypothetical protein